MSTPQGQVPEAPNALRLAAGLCEAIPGFPAPTALENAAALELRRLHAENVALRARVQELGQMARDVNSRRVVELEAQLASIKAANAGSEAVAGMNEYGVRGYLAATLKCWHRLTGDEAAELVAMTQRLSGLYTHPSPPEGMVAEQALRKVLAAVQRYLPPDGPSAKDTLTKIIEIVDPWPLGRLEKL